jgi:hypothetical protein
MKEWKAETGPVSWRRSDGGAPSPRRWFDGAGHSSRYRAPFLTRFNPTDVAHPGELT